MKVEEFKEDQGLKRWSQKKFQKWVIEGIENYISMAGVMT